MAYVESSEWLTPAYAAAVEAVAAAREKMMVSRTHTAFIRGFPQHKAGWIPDHLTLAVDGAKLPWQSVELALRREAGTATPEPRTLPEHVDALKRDCRREDGGSMTDPLGNLLRNEVHRRYADPCPGRAGRRR